MKLLNLTLCNFMPYKGEQLVSFPGDPSRNVMMIYGDNMRGKTSFLNALRWAFYGRALGRHLRDIPLHSLHNIEATNEGDWTMEVSIQFDADGHRYDLRRRSDKKPLVAKPSRPEDFDVTVGLQRDGLAIPGYQIDSEINKFVPEQVSRFFLFDGELLQEYETLLIEGSEQGRRIKEAIEQVLGVPALIHGRDEAATLLKKAQKLQSLDLSHVQGLERQADKQKLLQDKQESLERDLDTLNEKHKALRLERQKLDDELERTESVYQAKASLTAREQRQKDIIDTQKGKREERLQLISRVWRDFLQPKLAIKHGHLVQERQRLTEQIGDRRAILEKIAQLQSILDTERCPTCGQSISEERRNSAGKDLGRLQGELKTVEVDNHALTRVLADITAIEKIMVVGVSGQIREIDSGIRKLDVELTKVENDIERLREEIRGYDTAEISRKRTLRDSLLREEAVLEKDISNQSRAIDNTKKELAIVAKAIQSKPAARAAKSTAMVMLCTALGRAFSESIERLREDLRQHVQAMATQAFKAMISQKAYQGLEINRNYGLTILDENWQPVSIRSAGAEQIVALSLIDGLSRTGRAAGPVVMDTPFGRLDLKHRDNILRYFPTATSQLVLLVHSGEIRRETDLAPIINRIGTEYEIREINPRYSKIERMLS